MLLTLLPVAVLVGCGGDSGASGVPRADFERVVQERLHATGTQASCIADYVYDEYDQADIETIYREGIGAVPANLWDPWFHTAVACMTHRA